MVIHTVGLTILADDFAQARASLDRILATHNGFAAQLSVNDSKGVAQSLTATLRIPVERLAAAAPGTLAATQVAPPAGAAAPLLPVLLPAAPLLTWGGLAAIMSIYAATFTLGATAYRVFYRNQ